MSTTIIVETEDHIVVKDTGIETVIVQIPGLMGPKAALPWELALPITGRAYANEPIFRYDAPDIITLDISGCFGSCDIPATSNASFNLMISNTSVSNTSIGTITFLPNNKDANVSLTSTLINKRDILNVYAPANQDLTLADITITLKGER